MKFPSCLYLCAALAISITALAQEGTATNHPASNAPKPLAPLVDYVLKNGKPSVAETYLTKNLQLGENDVPVIQKGWLGRDKLDHLVVISQSDHDAVVFLRFDKEFKGVGWLTSPTGQLRCTVEFDRGPHESHVVANETHAGEFELEKKYLLGRAQAARAAGK